MTSKSKRHKARPRARYERDNGPLTAEQMREIRRRQTPCVTSDEVQAARRRLKGSVIRFETSCDPVVEK